MKIPKRMARPSIYVLFIIFKIAPGFSSITWTSRVINVLLIPRAFTLRFVHNSSMQQCELGRAKIRKPSRVMRFVFFFIYICVHIHTYPFLSFSLLSFLFIYLFFCFVADVIRASRNESNVNPPQNYENKLRRIFPYRLVASFLSSGCSTFSACNVEWREAAVPFVRIHDKSIQTKKEEILQTSKKRNVALRRSTYDSSPQVIS